MQRGSLFDEAATSRLFPVQSDHYRHYRAAEVVFRSQEVELDYTEEKAQDLQKTRVEVA